MSVVRHVSLPPSSVQMSAMIPSAMMGVLACREAGGKVEVMRTEPVRWLPPC